MPEDILSPYKRQFTQLHQDANTWRGHWKSIAEVMQPRKGRYLTGVDKGQTNDGSNKSLKMINGTGFDAIRVMASGMQSGLTSPARPWFVLALADKDLMEFAPVREWLFMVRDIMLNVFSRSNFYQSTHTLYGELGTFGTAAMLIEEDFNTVIRCRPYTIGEYYLALDRSYRPDTLYRQYTMTARQMKDEFGEEGLSQGVKTALASDHGETTFEVIHAIRPNTKIQEGKADFRGMPYESVYYQKGATPEVVLKRSGYRDIPFTAPRWDVTSTDTYGNSPGMVALGDVRMLQKMEEKKLKALDKMVDPPMNAPTSLKTKGGTIIAGGVNYVDLSQGGQGGLTPAYLVRPDLQNIAFEIDRVEQRILRFFYNDLFLTLSTADKNMTATEVVRRYDEKLQMLGPVTERLQSEFLDINIGRVYGIMDRFGMFPPPPEEIQGLDFKIEYISLLAQAQKMAGVTAIERTAAFVQSISAIKPNVVDKFNADEAVEQIAESFGAPPSLIVSDDVVAQIRQQRAAAEAAQNALAAAQPLADSSKKLSEAVLDKNSALDKVMEGLPGGQS